jgi:hypothetical protein
MFLADLATGAVSMFEIPIVDSFYCCLLSDIISLYSPMLSGHDCHLEMYIVMRGILQFHLCCAA